MKIVKTTHTDFTPGRIAYLVPECIWVDPYTGQRWPGAWHFDAIENGVVWKWKVFYRINARSTIRGRDRLVVEGEAADMAAAEAHGLLLLGVLAPEHHERFLRNPEGVGVR